MTPFEMEIEVQQKDIDGLGHVNNVTYVRWVQDVAVAHWKAVADPVDQASLAWVVARHEIDYKRPAFASDLLLLRTWVGSATRLRFERFTEVIRRSDEVVLAQARTVWIPISRTSGKPTPVRPEVRAVFSSSDATDA